MKIKIAHLYYDILNLYGENGNVRALKKFIERQDVKCEVHFLTIGDKINFNDYDMFYMGMGTEKGMYLVLNDIMKYKDEIKEAIENGKFFLCTGNSLELFGQYILDKNYIFNDCLEIFEYHSRWKYFRITESVLATTKFIKYPIIGFQNRCGHTYYTETPLFKIKEGTGTSLNQDFEGFQYKNFYATYILGPLLIRNPYFTNYLVKKLISSKNKKYKFKLINNIDEVKAYNAYLENFVTEKK